jgi:hypothetical protein
MVCIAAFIILALAALSLPVVRLFNKPAADKIWALLKKAWYCVGRRVTLRKCDSNFKDEVKHSVLKKVIIKHPKWVKPIGAAIEVVSVLIVIITIWSVLTVVKSGLSLYVYGTCDVSSPSACSLDATESCAIDVETPGFFEDPAHYIGGWFGEFGEVIGAIPNRLKTWNTADYVPKDATYYNQFDSSKPTVLEVIDPGCIVCKNSWQNIAASDFTQTYNLTYLAYPIKTTDGYKFKNSYIVASYLQAVRDAGLQNDGRPTDWQMINKLFTGKNSKKIPYQTAFNTSYSAAQAKSELQTWLADFGFAPEHVAIVAQLAESKQVKDELDANRSIVDDKIKAKKIPTFIYNGKKHDGLFEPEKL